MATWPIMTNHPFATIEVVIPAVLQDIQLRLSAAESIHGGDFNAGSLATT